MSLAALLDRLPIPILQAPMLGASTPALAATIGAAGGLGALAGGGWAPEAVEGEVAAFRAMSDSPFAVNLLMAPAARPQAAEVDAALAQLAGWYERVGAPLPAAPNDYAPDFQAQLAALTRAAPPVASFTFGLLTPAEVAALQARGTYVIGTATTVAEARAWAQAGADGICAQGFEAGGHRGHFLGDPQASLVGTLALVATIRTAVDLPVIAAGGIMDGRGVAAVLALGASAAQMGSAFLLSDQAAVNPLWRTALEQAPDDATRLTRAITGRYARGIETQFMRQMRPVEDEVPAYPVQNRLTQPLRAAALAAGEPEALSLWAGQAATLARAGDAGEMVKRWWAEAGDAARMLNQRTGRTT
jgi:nitronate monooxygenase